MQSDNLISMDAKILVSRGAFLLTEFTFSFAKSICSFRWRTDMDSSSFGSCHSFPQILLLAITRQGGHGYLMPKWTKIARGSKSSHCYSININWLHRLLFLLVEPVVFLDHVCLASTSLCSKRFRRVFRPFEAFFASWRCKNWGERNTDGSCGEREGRRGKGNACPQTPWFWKMPLWHFRRWINSQCDSWPQLFKSWIALSTG